MDGRDGVPLDIIHYPVLALLKITLWLGLKKSYTVKNGSQNVGQERKH